MSGDRVLVLASAVCQVDDELLMVRHGHGAAGGEWSVPRVRVRAGEALGEAVVRACADQAGCEVLCGPFLGWDEHPEAEPHTVEVYFQAVLVDPASATTARVPGTAGEAAAQEDPGGGPGVPAEARFVPSWAVADLRLAAGVAEFLADAGVLDTVV